VSIRVQNRLQNNNSAQLLLKIFFGAGLALGLPPLGLWWLAGISLSCLIIVESKQSTRSVWSDFRHGLCFGLGYFCFALHWIGFAFLVDAAEFLWMMPFAVGGLSLFLSCYWGLAFVIAHHIARRGFPLWLVLPLALSFAEYMRGVLFTGFPWGAPGLQAMASDATMQLASLFGMVGLTLLVLLWGMLPGALWLGRHRSLLERGLMIALLATLPLGYFWGSANPTQY